MNEQFCMHCMAKIYHAESICHDCGKNLEGNIPAHHLRAGTVLNNRYYVGKAIGEGGFGITYIGIDINLMMKIAIKEYFPSGYVNRNNTSTQEITIATTQERADFVAKGCARFIDEARGLARFVNETGVVGVRDFFETNNTAYIVMDYLDGITLKEYLISKKRISPDETLALMSPIINAMTRIHKVGLIHRDISPDNIMLVCGTSKLLDFGSARDMSSECNKSLSVMLKEGYAPEEQYRSRGDQGPWTDVYALCATMYKCITGITPDSATQRIFSDKLQRPSSMGIAIDKHFEDALFKGLSIRQTERYQDMNSLMDAFSGKIDETTAYYPEASINIAEEDDDEKTVFGGFINTPPPTPAPAPPPKSQPKQAPPIQKPTPEPAPEAEYKIPKKKKKKFAALKIIAAVLVLLIALASFAISANFGTVTIAGVDYAKTLDYDYLSISDATLTIEDIKAMKSFNNMQSLFFSRCNFEPNAFAELSAYSSDIMGTLSFSACTGIDDYSVLSDFTELYKLDLETCKLTNEELAEIDFANYNGLYSLSLSGNTELSDLSPLLNNLNINILSIDDCTNINLSSLEGHTGISILYANRCNLADISCIASMTNLYVATLNENSITDTSALGALPRLGQLELSYNSITDLSGLSASTELEQLTVTNNNIESISGIEGNTDLYKLYLSANEIVDITPLSTLDSLLFVDVSENNLTSLNGLENSLSLRSIYSAGNNLTSTDGLHNATILEVVDLSNNAIEDISTLAKSAKSLTTVSLNNNNISDISALTGAEMLEVLSISNNSITDISLLANAMYIDELYASNNKISDISALGKTQYITKLDLSYNEITDVSALTIFEVVEENGEVVYTGSNYIWDFSHNNISDITLSGGVKYSSLYLYDNDIAYYNIDENVFINSMYIDYSETERYGNLSSDPDSVNITTEDGLKIDFTDTSEITVYSLYVIDCPDDKKVPLGDILGHCNFYTLEEIDNLKISEEA